MQIGTRPLSWDSVNPNNQQRVSDGVLFPTTGYSSIDVTLTITLSTGAAAGVAELSGLRQGFLYAGISIDKQISVDGVTWLDLTKGNVADNPTVFSGTPLYERVVVTNLGNMPVNGATMSTLRSPTSSSVA